MNQQQQWQWLWQWQQKYNICWLALENPTGNECIGSLVVHCSQVVVAQWLSKCVSVCLKPNCFFAYMFSVCLLFFQCKHRWLQHNIYFIYKTFEPENSKRETFSSPDTEPNTRQFIWNFVWLNCITEQHLVSHIKFTWSLDGVFRIWNLYGFGISS